ncbi:unnamed protein product [Acanthoscelides obtectus]|uniref:Uncharacterized protein n=1 Tax=Acanthoscelides obtectus TaxID=200917 RepID=A0A9P0K1G2_ACAOB|nr:unnamed protein product [Acanthoscelides obtectus]CAK1649339.1 hypothetical protein AOBTE_LOCUS16170 [Acanthoscelides obtectus]
MPYRGAVSASFVPPSTSSVLRPPPSNKLLNAVLERLSRPVLPVRVHPLLLRIPILLTADSLLTLADSCVSPGDRWPRARCDLCVWFVQVAVSVWVVDWLRQFYRKNWMLGARE